MSEIIDNNSILDIINDINAAGSIYEFNFLFDEIIKFIKYIDKNKYILNKEGDPTIKKEELDLLQEYKNKIKELEQIFIPDLFNLFMIYLYNLTNTSEVVVFNKNLLLFLYSIVGCEANSKRLFKLNIISDNIDEAKEKSKKETSKINEFIKDIINCTVSKTLNNRDTLEYIINNLLNDLICMFKDNEELEYDYTMDYFLYLLKLVTEHSIGNPKILKKILKVHDILWEYQDNYYEYDEFYNIYKKENYYSDDILAIFVYKMIDYSNYEDILKEIYKISEERGFLNTLNIIYYSCDNEEIKNIFELENIEDIQEKRLDIFNLCFEKKHYIKIKYLIKQSTYLSQKERELVFNEVLDRIKCLPNIIDFKTYFYFIKHSLKAGIELIKLFPKNEQYSQFNKFDIIKPLYNNDFQNADVLNYVLNSDLIKNYLGRYIIVFLSRQDIINYEEYKNINVSEEYVITNDQMYKWLNNLIYISQNEEEYKMNNYYIDTIITNLYIFMNKFSGNKINDFFAEIDEKIDFINIENYKFFTNKVFDYQTFKNSNLKFDIAFNLIKNSTKYTNFDKDYNDIFNNFIAVNNCDSEYIRVYYNNLLNEIKKSDNSMQIIYSENDNLEESIKINSIVNKLLKTTELSENFDKEMLELEIEEKKNLKRKNEGQLSNEFFQSKRQLGFNCNSK